MKPGSANAQFVYESFFVIRPLLAMVSPRRRHTPNTDFSDLLLAPYAAAIQQHTKKHECAIWAKQWKPSSSRT
jgi:hypothetical protein